MTDAAYCLRQTEKERKTLARQSRYKKNGSRTNYVRLPQTYMTQKEWKKMNSKIEAMSLGKVYSKDEFRKFNDDLKRMYIEYLVKNYDARRIDIGKMLGYTDNGFWSLSKQLYGGKEPYTNKGKKASQAWLNFVKQDDAQPVEEAPLDSEEPKVQSDTSKVQDVAPIDGNNLILESYRVRYSGNIVLACADILKMLRHDRDYVINVEIYPATETPTCLPF